MSYCTVKYKMHQIPKFKWFSSRLAVVCAQSIEAQCKIGNEDAVGAAPTGDAPTTSEWPTVLLPVKVWLILEIWLYILLLSRHDPHSIDCIFVPVKISPAFYKVLYRYGYTCIYIFFFFFHPTRCHIFQILINLNRQQRKPTTKL